MEQVTLIAPAKINWGLDIVGKRADGYHLLCTLMQSVGLFDRVRIQKSERDCCVCSPPLYGNGENLALRAWHLLKQEYVLPGGLCLEIDKGIPEGGGLAGGSTDAAAVLLGVDRLFRLGLGEERLADLGLRLGADLPFCLKGGLALVEGIGERLLPQRALRSYHLVLVNPGFPVSTAEVYRQFSFDQIAAHPESKGPAGCLGGRGQERGRRLLRQSAGNPGVYPASANRLSERALPVFGPGFFDERQRRQCLGTRGQCG